MRRNLRRYVAYAAAPLLGLAAGAAWAPDFVRTALQHNLALNGKIILAMAFGAALMYRLVWRMTREDRALREFVRVAETLRALPREQAVKRLEELLLSPGWARLDVRRVLEPAVQTGGRIESRLEQAAIEQEMQSLRELLEARWELPNFMAGLMVALGLLGTFIGLLNTLVGTASLIERLGNQGNLDQALGTLVTGLGPPLAGMGTAFSASMFGVVGSLVLGLIMVAVRACGNALLGNVKHAVHSFTVTSALREGHAASPAQAGASEAYVSGALVEVFAVQREVLETFSRSMQEVRQAASRTDAVMNKVEALTVAVQNQAQALQRQNELVGVGPRMRELAEQSLLEMQRLCALSQAHGAGLEQVGQGFAALDARMAGHLEAAARDRQLLREAMGQSLESQQATRTALAGAWAQETDTKTALIHEMHALRQSSADTQAAMLGWSTRLGHLQELASDQLVQAERQSADLKQLAAAVHQLGAQLVAGADQTRSDALAGRQAQVEVAKQISGVATVLRLTNETLAERITQVADATAQYSASAAALAQEMALLKNSVGKDVRKEVREALVLSGVAELSPPARRP